MPTIIFVPGILGSRLEKKVKEDKSELMWDPDQGRSFFWGIIKYPWPWLSVNVLKKDDDAKWDKIGKMLDHERTEALCAMVKTRKINKDSSKAWNQDKKEWEDNSHKWEKDRWLGASCRYYGTFLKKLKQETMGDGWTVKAFPYDWRQSNWESGKKLLTVIQKERETSDGPILLITHSMGGLVARSALKQLENILETISNKDPRKDLISDIIKAVVHIYQPTFGVPAAYWRLCTGWGEGGSDSGLALGNSQKACTQTHAGWASVTELLPTNTYCRLLNELKKENDTILNDDLFLKKGGDSKNKDIYNLYKDDKGLSVIDPKASSKNNKRFKENILNAKKFHEEYLKDYFFPNTYIIDSTHVSTTVSVQEYANENDAKAALPGPPKGYTFVDEQIKGHKPDVQQIKNGKWLVRANQDKGGDGTVSASTIELVRLCNKNTTKTPRFLKGSHELNNKEYGHDKLDKAAGEIIDKIKEWKLFMG